MSLGNLGLTHSRCLRAQTPNNRISSKLLIVPIVCLIDINSVRKAWLPNQKPRTSQYMLSLWFQTAALSSTFEEVFSWPLSGAFAHRKIKLYSSVTGARSCNVLQHVPTCRFGATPCEVHRVATCLLFWSEYPTLGYFHSALQNPYNNYISYQNACMHIARCDVGRGVHLQLVMHLQCLFKSISLKFM